MFIMITLNISHHHNISVIMVIITISVLIFQVLWLIVIDLFFGLLPAICTCFNCIIILHNYPGTNQSLRMPPVSRGFISLKKAERVCYSVRSKSRQITINGLKTLGVEHQRLKIIIKSNSNNNNAHLSFIVRSSMP